jgi:hypothetical protein
MTDPMVSASISLAAKCEAQAKQELQDLIADLERANDNARENPMAAFGSDAFGRIGGLFALADVLRRM